MIKILYLPPLPDFDWVEDIHDWIQALAGIIALSNYFISQSLWGTIFTLALIPIASGFLVFISKIGNIFQAEIIETLEDRLNRDRPTQLADLSEDTTSISDDRVSRTEDAEVEEADESSIDEILREY